MSSAIEIDKPEEQVTGREALGLQAEARRPSPSSRPALRRRKDVGPAPLSFAQERLWFLDQINQGDVSANISRGVRISGAINLDALKQALHALVVRHESLRTTFAKTELYAGVDSQPQQLIAENGSVELSVVDLSHLSANEREQRARELARDESQRPFDLTLGPLLRPQLLRLSDRDYVMLLNTHRIVCDELSTEIFFDDLWECYRRLVSGQSQPLEEMPVRYVDYAAWQHEWLQGDVLKTQLDYWQAKLDGAPAVIELPTEGTRPAVQTWHGASASTVLAKELMEKLSALKAREDVTLFMILMAAFQVLLSRYSRQSDVVVGATVANRDLEETKGLIGPFANSLVFRTDVTGNPTFRELLDRVRTMTLAAEAHESIPFEKLIEELKVQRSLSQAPVFQVMLNLRSAKDAALDLAGLHVEPFDFETGITPLDLTLNVMEDGEQLNCRLEYNTDLFKDATISQMLGHWQTLLGGIAANPAERISGLPLLTAPEREKLLSAWNDTRIEYALQCIDHLFEAQVEKMPEATAIVFGGQQLSYRELNNRANQLAHYLQRRGVAPEVLVAVCMERSLELVVALLAILKAGGAYVPLDPAYPGDRLAYMLSDAKVAVLLTQQRLREMVPGYCSYTIEVDTDWPLIAEESKANPASGVLLDDLAYVIYTSGSTGRPKGTMNTHRGLCNRLLWMQDAYRLTATDAVLQKTPFSFDVSVWEFFWPLITGARLVVARPGGQQDGAYLARAIREHRITTLHFVPSMLQVFLEQAAVEHCESVRQVISSGEALSFELQERFFGRSRAKLHNLYGPTEASIDVTHWECRQNDARRAVPIGRPIANTQIYILDEWLQPVPCGVAGELFIGGVGLGRGYLKQAGLTAEKFIPDPFGDEPGARLYRTGDLARYRDDGAIEFLGRIDDQVKIRGFRIELGEIESVLAEHESVRECAVIAEEHPNGDKRLVAYVVASRRDLAEESENILSSLRALLRQRLPEYMVPTAFVSLEALPLMPNGKLNRRLLPRPEDNRPDLEVAFVVPRNRLEEQLVFLWEKVLGLKSVGVKDNFFELGGHSLLAARLFAQIENRLGRNLPLATLFQAPTIEQLAAVLRAKESWRRWSSLVAIQPKGSRPPLFCVHAAGANVLIYRPLARHLGMDQPVYALQAQGLDGQSEPHLRVEDMAAHYISEMRAFQPEGPYFLLGASFGGLVIFEMARQLLAQGQQVALLGMLNTNCPVFSFAGRIRCHIGHLLQKGPRTYLQAGARSVMRRIRRNSSMLGEGVAPDRELQQVIESRSDADDPLVRTVLAILQAERDYVPARRICPGKITLFWARDAEKGFEENRLGWKKLAAGGLEVHVVPGNHTTMREEPNVAVLVELLKPCLEAAQISIAGYWCTTRTRLYEQ